MFNNLGHFSLQKVPPEGIIPIAVWPKLVDVQQNLSRAELYKEFSYFSVFLCLSDLKYFRSNLISYGFFLILFIRDYLL